MNSTDKTYLNLLEDILENGIRKSDRTGTGTISVFSREIRFKMSEGFPLLTTKKMFTKGIITELLWFLNGETNIKPLVEQGNMIWVGDAYKKYVNTMTKLNLELKHRTVETLSKEEFTKKVRDNEHFADQWGELGPVYGKQWVDWGGFEIVSGEEIEGYNKGVNQIQKVMDLLRDNPDSRRNMVSAWNVGDLEKMVLPPCHFGFQFYSRELSIGERMKIHNPDNKPMGAMVYTHDFFDSYDIPRRTLSLKWEQRSVDTFLGLPFNITSYALLLHMVAQQMNMLPDELIGSLGDVHLYNDHIDHAKEQLTRVPYKLPKLKLNKAKDIFSYTYDDFEFEGYESHPLIKANLSN